MPQKRHGGPCRALDVPGARRFDPLFLIANDPAIDRSRIARALTLTMFSRMMSPDENGMMFNPGGHFGLTFTSRDVGPLHRMVVACLEKIVAGDRHPAALQAVYAAIIGAPAGSVGFDANGERESCEPAPLARLVFYEIIVLARFGGVVKRCALASHPGKCQHFFIPRRDDARCCHEECADRLVYLNRPRRSIRPARRKVRRASHARRIPTIKPLRAAKG
jgi:hypothetical protein